MPQFLLTLDDGDAHWFVTSDSSTYDFEPDVGATVTATTGTVIVAEGADILPDRADVGITAVGVATMLGDPPDPIIRLAGFVDIALDLSCVGVARAIVPTDPTDPGGGTGGTADYETIKATLFSELIPTATGYRTLGSIIEEIAQPLSSYSSKTSTVLDKAVMRFGTFLMPYPPNESNLSDYLDRGHQMWDSVGTIYQYGQLGFSLTFLPGWILVTNLADRTFPAGEKITLYLMKATPSGTTAVEQD